MIFKKNSSSLCLNTLGKKEPHLVRNWASTAPEAAFPTERTHSLAEPYSSPSTEERAAQPWPRAMFSVGEGQADPHSRGRGSSLSGRQGAAEPRGEDLDIPQCSRSRARECGPFPAQASEASCGPCQASGCWSRDSASSSVGWPVEGVSTGGEAGCPVP